ncbi:MAG TPA: acetamidase/formamidase family protein [Acidimicrobiia bacterium]|jgi:acetamidase/formamidase|nr:acetamidase/formamidase family protein [Acidimicrobiia bacterium]
MADLRHFDAGQTTLFFDPVAEPIAELADGERVIVDTTDSICGIWREARPEGMHIDEVIERLGGACPLTGPFAVTGAAAGDILEVDFHRVEPRPLVGTGWTGSFRGFGALTTDVYGLQDPLPVGLEEIAYDSEAAHLRAGGRDRAIPIHPFLGTVGVAPPRERRMSFSQAPEYLGDVDQPGITAGSTLVLPVNVDGGLLSLGDAHAAQGDGEITGVGIEIESTVELTVRVSDRETSGFVSLPQLNTVEAIGSIAGLQGVSLSDCARAAYTDLARRLITSYGFDREDAYVLLGQVGRLQVGNMIDPFYSVCASVGRRFVEG